MSTFAAYSHWAEFRDDPADPKLLNTAHSLQQVLLVSKAISYEARKILYERSIFRIRVLDQLWCHLRELSASLAVLSGVWGSADHIMNVHVSPNLDHTSIQEWIVSEDEVGLGDPG